MTGPKTMERQFPGRPRIQLTMRQVLEAVRRHGRVLTASHELGCSAAYVHARLKEAGLSLLQVLEAAHVDELLENAGTRGQVG
ncbi:MAG: hypothetical protein IIB33_01985 [Chloroflexi bacterium]|nr:hypothetical protein [Chloroflexota bacterium]